jgi:hypothetical protein
MTSPAEVLGYLGGVVDSAGVATGTCFQIRPGVLVTAWHVIDGLRVGAAGDTVTVGPLTGGDTASATVHAVDDLRDLAVLTCAVPLPGSVAGLVASESIPATTDVQITGAADIPKVRFALSSTTGTWQGPGVGIRATRIAAPLPHDPIPSNWRRVTASQSSPWPIASSTSCMDAP